MDKKEFVLKAVADKKALIVDVSDKIFDYAEVGFHEFKTAKLYEEVLKKEGFQVEMGVGGMPTAFKAVYGSGKPVIGFLAEYDALPELSQEGGCTMRKEAAGDNPDGHGCGHNLLGAGAMAAALAVKAYIEEHPEAGDHIEDREIGSPRLWEIKVAGCRTLERTDLRQQNSRRESAGKQGVDSKPRTALHVFSYRSRFFQNKKCDEIKHQKQAGHDGNIVVGQNGKPKGHAVEHSLLFPHKTLQSVNDQREEENAVQPHDIPAVRRHISGQRIKNPEKSDTQNTVFTVLF